MTDDTPYDLLVHLCERQEELPTNAHVAVMEAFNRVAEVMPARLPATERPSDAPIRDLLGQAIESINRRSATETDLHVCLLYAEARELVEIALDES